MYPFTPCHISESTVRLRGGLESVIIDNQVYRVKYSGPDNVLERFSITSIDPITGQWTIELESEDGLMPQAHAMGDEIVKIKYRTMKSPIITVSSE